MRIPNMKSMAALLQRSDCKSLRYFRAITFTETRRIVPITRADRDSRAAVLSHEDNRPIFGPADYRRAQRAVNGTRLLADEIAK